MPASGLTKCSQKVAASRNSSIITYSFTVCIALVAIPTTTASNPLSIDTDSIDKSLLDKEANLISEELKNSGKSGEIVKKITIGKINKFKQDNSLLSQLWVMDTKKKVQNIIHELNIPDLKIKDFYRIKIGE